MREAPMVPSAMGAAMLGTSPHSHRLSNTASRSWEEVSPWTKVFLICTSGFMKATTGPPRSHWCESNLIDILPKFRKNVGKYCVFTVSGAMMILIDEICISESGEINMCSFDKLQPLSSTISESDRMVRVRLIFCYALLWTESMNHPFCYLVTNYALQPTCFCKF